MEHVKQNDMKCLPTIRDKGCFVRSIGLMCEYKTCKKLTAMQINEVWAWAKASKHIDENDCVKNSQDIATRFLRVLGDYGHFTEVGLFKDGKTEFYPWFREHQPELCRIDGLIQKVETNGPIGTHFRLVDKAGRLIEDPHEPRIYAKKILYSILYAYTRG